MSTKTFDESVRRDMLERGFNPTSQEHLIVYSKLGPENYERILKDFFIHLTERERLSHKKSSPKEFDRMARQELQSALVRLVQVLNQFEFLEFNTHSVKIPELKNTEISCRILRAKYGLVDEPEKPHYAHC